MTGDGTQGGENGSGADDARAADVLEELYGADPEEFIRTRTRLARAAREDGDRERASRISELRKPTVAAWAVNRLTRERPVEVDRLLDLGRRMRAAQAALDVTVLQGLRGERDAVLDAFTRAARFVADDGGHGLSVTAATAVRATCVAALADERAAEAVASGALVRTLDYAGFGEVDLDDAVAEGFVPALRPRRTPAEAALDGGGARPATVAAGSTRAVEASTDEAPADDGAQRALRRRLEEEIAQADQELARASLVAAEHRRLATKAADRVEELSRLLDAARVEAADREAAAREAESDRERASSDYEQVRARLAAL